MARSFYDDYGDYDPCCDQCGNYPCVCDFEEIEHQAYLREKERISAMTAEQLGKEWRRNCRRHDNAVDRCEQLNSPTIEDAQGWMTFIEKEFERRGIDRFQYTLGEDEA